MQTAATATAGGGEDTLRKSYDRVPYPGTAHFMTHPNLLAALAYMYGMNPPASDRCRVLELGCGDGGNIIPMAYAMPDSEFVGIDLSPVQIEQGMSLVNELGLSNIELVTRSIMDLSAGDGPFDYIIAHGVYSWVPPAVQDKMLEICGTALSPDGVAYISYNTYPGWYFNRSMRDMMLYRTRGMDDPAEQLRAALSLVDTIVEHSEDGTDLHHAQMKFFRKGLASYNHMESYLTHDYMEEHNNPVYFHEFAERAAKHRLQHLCDADYTSFEPERLGPEVFDEFRKFAADRDELEQYIDFLRNTRFRRSLICGAGHALDRSYDGERLRKLYASTDLDPVLDSPEQGIEEASAFRTTEGRTVRAEHPFARAILIRLCHDRPAAVAADTLIRDAIRTAGEEISESALELAGRVLHSLFFNGLVELLRAPRRCKAAVSERPEASAVARLQAATRKVTNLRHKTIDIDDDMACLLLDLVDGTRDRAALLELVNAATTDGRLSVREGSDMERLLDVHLRKMAKHALLVG